MDTIFDTIIWGPSLEGIIKAIELKNKGEEVLLAGKFGFPGGKAAESLASLYTLEYLNSQEALQKFLKEAENLRYGVLFRNPQWVLLHPEAVKRLCWQLINENNLQILFHVTPLEVNLSENPEIELFGREGKFTLKAKNIVDLSDDKYLDALQGKKETRSVIINSFFSDPLPPDLPGFHIIRRFETPIGEYISISLRNVPANETEQAFNRELDRLSKESWKKHQARIMMVPVYPEII